MTLARLISLVLAAPLACAAADAPSASACTVLAGGGRQALPDAQANEGWNRLNFSFFDAALTALSAQQDVVPAFFTLGSRDAAQSADAALAQASRQGCARVMLVSVYDDDSKPEGELVFSVRAAPLRTPGAASAPAATRGDSLRTLAASAPDYEREYRYLATPATLSKVVPSRIAEQAVRDYLASVKR
jgi:hypothetical protein